MGLLSQIFTWWDGQTLGTRIWTARKGVKVGEDEQGNVFYRSADGERRWVIYDGAIDASRISADWHGWLHHTYQFSPAEKPMTHKTWEKPHQPNLTGTPSAYHPAGSQYAEKTVSRQSYDAWSPE